jgi:hypothetical protein
MAVTIPEIMTATTPIKTKNARSEFDIFPPTI